MATGVGLEIATCGEYTPEFWIHLLEIQKDILDDFLVFFEEKGRSPFSREKMRKSRGKAPELQEMNSKFRLLDLNQSTWMQRKNSLIIE